MSAVLRMPLRLEPVSKELLRSLTMRKMRLICLKRRRTMLQKNCDEIGELIRELQLELSRDEKAVHARLAAGAEIED